MNIPEMPFINNTFEGLGTAPALERPDLELGDDVPIAINPDEVSREAERYVFFAGNVITPHQKRERADLRLGGEYFGQEYKTLIRSKGLLRRCQITPLEKGFDFFGDEQIGDNATGLHVVAQLQHASSNTPLAPSKLNAVQIYPGDEIKGILRGNSNGTNKGFVELKKLAGITYADFRESGIQEFIFPEWKEILAGAKDLPVKLSALQLHLTERRTATTDLDLREVIENMLVSCDTYREWGTRYLKFSSMLVKVPAHMGFVHTYSDLAEMLFVELEVRREDMLADNATADAIARAQAGSANAADQNRLISLLEENQKFIREMMMGKAPKTETVKLEEVESIPKDEEQIAVQASAQPTPDPTKCSAITGTGAQCTNEADETGRCKHPAHRL